MKLGIENVRKRKGVPFVNGNAAKIARSIVYNEANDNISYKMLVLSLGSTEYRGVSPVITRYRGVCGVSLGFGGVLLTFAVFHEFSRSYRFRVHYRDASVLLLHQPLLLRFRYPKQLLKCLLIYYNCILYSK